MWGVNYTNIEKFLDIIKVEGTDWSGFAQEKIAALVGEHVIERYEWKVGDKIILRYGLGEEIPFIIRGVVYGSGSNTIYLNLPYYKRDSVNIMKRIIKD